MDGLGIERAAVVGNSFGCAVALRVAVAAPERVSALVLLSGRAPGAQPSRELAAAWQAEEEAIERGDVDAALQAVVDAWTLPGAPEDLRAKVAAWQRRAYDLQGFDEPPPDAPDPLDLDPGWPARLTMPVLLAAGEREFPTSSRASRTWPPCSPTRARRRWPARATSPRWRRRTRSARCC